MTPFILQSGKGKTIGINIGHWLPAGGVVGGAALKAQDTAYKVPQTEH